MTVCKQQHSQAVHHSVLCLSFCVVVTVLTLALTGLWFAILLCTSLCISKYALCVFLLIPLQSYSSRMLCLVR